MSEKLISPDVAEDLVAEVTKRVGNVGNRSIAISKIGERFSRISISRGGIVIPSMSYREYRSRSMSDSPQVVYQPNLADIRHQVGVTSQRGRHRFDNGELELDHAASRRYALMLSPDGEWSGYEVSHETEHNYWTELTTYYTGQARPATLDDALAIRTLLTAFDTSLQYRATAATNNIIRANSRS